MNNEKLPKTHAVAEHLTVSIAAGMDMQKIVDDLLLEDSLDAEGISAILDNLQSFFDAGAAINPTDLLQSRWFEPRQIEQLVRAFDGVGYLFTQDQVGQIQEQRKKAKAGNNG